MLRIDSWLASSLRMLILAVAGCGGQVDDAKPGDACAPGDLKCTCIPNGTCNQGLQCLSNRCVAAAGGTPAAAGMSSRGGMVSLGGTIDVFGIGATGGAVNVGGAAIAAGGMTSASGGLSGCSVAGGNFAQGARPNCGNGIVDATSGETCDDGNRNDGDGCSANCLIEPNWNCPSPCSPCVATVMCGNGLVEVGEQCDPGQDSSGIGGADISVLCASDCTILMKCGDGIVQHGETCDDGINDGSYGSCTSNCQRAAYCGDGVKNGIEQCDYGSFNSPMDDPTYGGCLTNCQLGPHCGDGIVQSPPEQCDNGGTYSTACRANCNMDFL